MRLLHLVKFWPAWLLLLFAGTASATNYPVTVGGATLTFSPANLTIMVGDTVTFTNAGGTHNVHADDGSFRCANGCDAAGGDGTPSGNAWTATVTFNQAGTVSYHCDVHVSLGMVGSITVMPAQGGGGGGGGGNVPITSGFTGAWYDPSQSGHGLFLEVLPNNTLVAWWFTFTPDGTQQAWFGGTGTINGNTAVLDVVLTTGGQWPSFDPSRIVNNPWGTLTFTFTDCTHGRVDFASTYPGYGSGHLDLTRLTDPSLVTCP